MLIFLSIYFSYHSYHSLFHYLFSLLNLYLSISLSPSLPFIYMQKREQNSTLFEDLVVPDSGMVLPVDTDLKLQYMASIFLKLSTILLTYLPVNKVRERER